MCDTCKYCFCDCENIKPKTLFLREMGFGLQICDCIFLRHQCTCLNFVNKYCEGKLAAENSLPSKQNKVYGDKSKKPNKICCYCRENDYAHIQYSTFWKFCDCCKSCQELVKRDCIEKNCVNIRNSIFNKCYYCRKTFSNLHDIVLDKPFNGRLLYGFDIEIKEYE